MDKTAVSVGPPLEGIRVVEAGRYAAGPSCATVLADWGATVIKLEPLTGDPARGPGSAAGNAVNPRFELHNRSRRSIALDLTEAGGREVAHRLIGDSDVFVTNMRPVALTRLGLDEPTLRQINERLIYGQITGYGLDSPAVNTPSFDHGAFWSYSGVASSFAGPDGTPPQPAGGLGDRTAGAMLAGAIGAGLFARERTGMGAHIATSLVATGVWLLGSDMSDAVRVGEQIRRSDRRQTRFPTINCYPTADGRWFWLQLMVAEEGWPDLLRAINAPWLDGDPRFAGGRGLAEHAAALVDALDGIFRSRTLDEWTERFEAHGVRFAAVQSVEQAAHDDLVHRSGAFVQVPGRDGTTVTDVASPCQFRETLSPPLGMAPLLGEHTDEILAELGYSVDWITALHRAETGH
jgi:crotonobetainyl-CoA:carnitine CoA-transferase CaiB-like acyl-CoA transferase